MREYSADIFPQLNGLRPSDDPAQNVPGAERCVGLVPREFGLVRPAVPHNPVDLTMSWPFQQIFYGRDYTLVADDEAIYVVDDATSWTLGTADVTPATGAMWHAADFGTYWVLTDATNLVYGKVTSLSTVTTPPIQSCCNHRGRIVYAGLDSDFWSAAWKAELARWEAKETTGLTLGYNMVANMVFWGAIGGGDIEMWLTDPSSTSLPIVGPLGAGSGYDMDRPYWLDVIRRGDVGWATMEWRGTARKVHPLGNSFVVYGDAGVSAVTPVDGAMQIRTLTRNIGIIGRGAAGGSDTFHVFVGDDWNLYAVTSKLELRKLGYKDALEDNLTSATIVTYDEGRNEIYIGDLNRGFILTQKGLSETANVPSSLFRYDGDLYGTPVNAAKQFDQIDIISGRIRIGSGSIKTVHSIEVDYQDIDDLRASLLFRYKQTDDYRETKRVRVSNGAAFVNTAGVDFKVRLLGSPRAGSTISGVRIRWQASDNRFSRGLYVAPTGQQQG